LDNYQTIIMNYIKRLFNTKKSIQKVKNFVIYAGHIDKFEDLTRNDTVFCQIDCSNKHWYNDFVTNVMKSDAKLIKLGNIRYKIWSAMYTLNKDNYTNYEKYIFLYNSKNILFEFRNICGIKGTTCVIDLSAVEDIYYNNLIKS